MSNRRLHIPQGTEAFYLEEALAHRAVLRTFEDQCALWGYMPVQTPVLDYHEPYRGVMAEEADASSYRLVDREGHLLSLRSDMTLFLARQMGMKLEPGDLPVRVYYGDTIIRHETTHHLSKDEYFQIGAELIGEPGIDADEEVVLMLLDLLEKLGAASVVVHIGQRALATAVAGTTTSDETVARLVAERAWHRLADELAACGVPAARSEQLLRLFQFIGGTDALQELSASLDGLEQAEKAAVEHLVRLGTDLEQLGYGNRIRIDMSEVGSQPYHSGVVFQGYAPSSDAPVASGGRYDQLLRHFGFDAPSVGFSIMLRRLQSSIDSLPEKSDNDVVTATGSTFVERARSAQSLRDQGKAVHL